MLFYWYDPQYLNAVYSLVRIQLPKRFKGCLDDEKIKGKHACEYPSYGLDKLVSSKFAKSGSPALKVIRKFSWTSADQNFVANLIAGQAHGQGQGCRRVGGKNKAKVNAWLEVSRAEGGGGTSAPPADRCQDEHPHSPSTSPRRRTRSRSRTGPTTDPRADRHPRACTRVARQRARAHGPARPRPNTGARGASRACPRTPRRRVSAARDVRLGHRRAGPRRALGGAAHARATAARLAAERATADDRAEHRRSSSRSWSTSRGEPDERKLIDLDQRIHRHIYECTHNPFLEATLNEYYVLTLRIWFLALDRVVRLDDAVREHASCSRRSGTGTEPGRNRRCGCTSRGSRTRSGASSDVIIFQDLANSYISRSAQDEHLPQPRHAPSSSAAASSATRIAYHLTRLGLDGRRPHRQGSAPEPGRVDRTCLELHLPGRPLQGDDAAHAREREPVQGDGGLHRVGRHRGRADRGADAGAARGGSRPRRRGESSRSRS